MNKTGQENLASSDVPAHTCTSIEGHNRFCSFNHLNSEISFGGAMAVTKTNDGKANECLG